MFYFLSKALLFALSPMYWIFGLVALSWQAKRPRWKRRWRNSAIALFLLLTNPYLFHTVCSRYELDKEYNSGITYDYAVVLGGYAEYNERSQDIEFYRGADRLTAAIELYSTGIVEGLIISSGVHEEGHPEWKESIISATFLQRLGVDSDDIVLEDKSWNTHQNAMYTRALLDSLEVDEPVLLITSAYHMRRASACFSKQGIEHHIHPVDYTTDVESWTLASALPPKIGLLQEWSLLFKEWMGNLVYRLRGYT